MSRRGNRKRVAIIGSLSASVILLAHAALTPAASVAASSSNPDGARWAGDVILLINVVLTAGILVTARAALGTWRAQLIGGKQTSLAEQCLDAAHDFSVRIKLLRMEESRRDAQIEELRQSLLDFQKILLRLNYYLTSPIGDDVPKAFVGCYALLDKNFRVLKEYGFKPPESGAVFGARGAMQNYQNAHNIFYGDCGTDQVVVKLDDASAQLGNVLRPLLTLKPAKGWLGRMIDRTTAAIRWLRSAVLCRTP